MGPAEIAEGRLGWEYKRRKSRDTSRAQKRFGRAWGNVGRRRNG
jgi:hypothetical protein